MSELDEKDSEVVERIIREPWSVLEDESERIVNIRLTKHYI